MRRTAIAAALTTAALLPALPAHAASPSPSPSPSCPPPGTPTLTVVTPTIKAGEPGTVRVHGEQADFIYLFEKQAQDTDFRVIASYQPTQSTDYEAAVTPRTNVDYKIRYDGGGPSRSHPAGCSEVPYYTGASRTPVRMSVATSLTLSKATHTGPRSYVFSGANKGHAGDLVNLYRLDEKGHPVLTAQVKSRTDGTYRIGRTFTGVGTFAFFTASPSDSANLAGESNRLRVQIR